MNQFPIDEDAKLKTVSRYCVNFSYVLPQRETYMYFRCFYLLYKPKFETLFLDSFFREAVLKYLYGFHYYSMYVRRSIVSMP